MTYTHLVDGVAVQVTDAENSAITGISAAGRSANVRDKRNQLIAETDWWATSDRTMTTEQTAYRQALRDITGQAGFPHDITWPTKPS